MTRVPARIALALALASAPLTGCGAEDVSPEAIADAAEATAATGGSSIYVEGLVEVAGREIEMEGDGVIDTAGKSAQLDYTFSGAGVEGDMEQVMKDYVMYMRMPAFEAELPGDKTWIKIDLRKTTKALGVDIGQFGQPAGGTDAARTLDYLRATGEVEKEGDDEVRGVETTHYRAVVDLRKYPALVPRAERAEAESGVEALIAATGESEVPTEVWIDERNLIRRMRQQLEMRMPGAGTLEMDIVTEFFDFGRRVVIEPPPEHLVEDVTDLAAEQAQRQAVAP